MGQLKGLKDLVFDTIEHTTHLVEQNHLSVARKYARRVQYIAPAVPVKVVNSVHCGIAQGVYTSIRLVTRAVSGLTEAGLVIASHRAGQEASKASSLQPEVTATLPTWVDSAQGVLNGAIGDYLNQRGNGLEIPMALHHQGQPLALEAMNLKNTLPRTNSKICLFVHGLGCTEQVWNTGAQRFYGDAQQNFGTMLARDLGYTPLYLRYNSGLHISQNGKQLADLLATLVEAYPGPIDEILLFGHSMGGLVVRSAACYGVRNKQPWLERLKGVFCIGSPHLGAPLEKASNVVAAVLSFFDTPGTQVPAQLFRLRSAGIKDLRFGYLVDEDWQGYDPDALLDNRRTPIPFAEGVKYYFIASTITRDPAHPLGQIVGDLLVCHKSAAGPRQPDHCVAMPFSRVFSGMNHFHLANHPEVYEQIKTLCADPAAV